MRIALKFAYNGIEFQGYARQPKLKTVEGEIIDSLIQNLNDLTTRYKKQVIVAETAYAYTLENGDKHDNL